MRANWLLPALGVALVLSVAAGLAIPPPDALATLSRPDTELYIAAALAAGLAYAAAVWLVRNRRIPSWSLAVILVAGLAARLLVLASPPVLSTDLYRYVWDGRVQAAGINPYRYVPADPALASLRDAAHGPTAIYPNINRADTARTIYPPAAQALFAAIGLAASSIWTVKAAMLAFDLATAAVGLLLLRAARRPLAQIVVWAWNPLVIWEFAGGGHIDAAALAFSAAALLLAARARPAWAGAALGIAVSMKFLPAALFPALWRRWNWRTPLAVAAIILGGYACYASVGPHVLGYLPGYAQEEGLEHGSGFLLLRLLSLLGPLPPWAGPVYIAASLLSLAALAALICFRRPLPAGQAARTNVIARDALLLSAALMALLSPHYPWYLTMLALPAIIVPAWSALWPTVLAPLLYLDYGYYEVLWPAIVFLPAIALLPLDLRSRRRAETPVLLPQRGS